MKWSSQTMIRSRNRVLNGIHHTGDIAADAVPDTRHHTLDGIQHRRYNRFDSIPDRRKDGLDRGQHRSHHSLNGRLDCLGKAL